MEHLTRRTLLGGIGAGVVGLSGCIEDDMSPEEPEVADLCEGECDIVTKLGIDSHGGVGTTYTTVTVELSEFVEEIVFSVEIRKDGNLISVENKTDENATSTMVQFDRFKTDDIADVTVIVHEVSTP